MTQDKTETNLIQAEEYLKHWIIKATRPEDFRLDVWVAQEKFYNAYLSLFDNKWGYLCAITGIDRPASLDEEGNPIGENHIEVLYHVAEGEAITTLHVLLPYSNLQLPSICELVPSASMYERELMEMLGVDLAGTPSREKLVLPDEWPDGIYPLRKSFKGLNTVTMEEFE